MIGEYEQLTDFTNENAGTSEWCKARKRGKLYFVKKFQSPVYPSKDLGLPEAKYNAKVKRFHRAKTERETMYAALRKCNTSGALVIPEEVINFQYHLCTVTEYITGNILPSDACRLSEWQRLILMRTLILAVMNVHAAGVVHADIKADNILITQNPETGACQLKLIDVDSSYMQSSPPETADDVVGDMAYWAPEIYAMFTREGIRLDEKTDLFALGIVLHYIWTGKLPASSGKDKTIGQSVLAGEAVTLDSSVPLVLQNVINGLIEAVPEKRISAADVYAILAIQLDKYPHTIIKLVEPPPPDPVVISVIYSDDNGNVLEKASVSVQPGSSVVIEAKEIEGYRLISEYRCPVQVSRSGIANTGSVQFTYHKKANIRVWIWLAVAVAILAWILMNSGITWSWGNGSDNGASSTVTPSYKPYALSVEPSATGANGLHIRWDHQSNATYNLTRDNTNGSETSQITVYSLTSNYYYDTDVIPGEKYTYEVTAYVDGNPVWYDTQEFYIAKAAPTHKPLSLTAYSDCGGVNLEWESQSGAAYTITRTDTSGSTTPLKTSTSSNYYDTSVILGEKYSYTVTAYISGKNVGCEEYTVQTRKPLYAWVENVTSDYVHIKWEQQNNTKYVVERRQIGISEWEWIYENYGAFYVDRDSLIGGRIYEYRVTAYVDGKWFDSCSYQVTIPTPTPSPTPTRKVVTPSPTPSALTVMWTDVCTADSNRSSGVFYTKEKIYFYGTLVGGNQYEGKCLSWRAVHNGEYPIAEKNFLQSASAGDTFHIWINVVEKGTWTVEVYYFENGKAIVIGRKTITVK